MTRRTWLASVGAALVATRLGPVQASRIRRLVDHAGPLPVTMSFVWRSDVVGNALATTRPQATRRHVVASDAVSHVQVTGAIGARQTPLVYGSYDPLLHMYTSHPIRGSDLEALLDPRSRATFTADLTFELQSFFDVLLAQMTRTDATLHNVAHPTDSGGILSTFDHATDDDGKATITYHSATHRMRAVPCTLVDYDVEPQAAPLPPAVRLVFELDVAPDDARKLVAMDWSRLAQFGSRTSPPPRIQLWRDNVLLYLANQTDMRRAERFRTAIAHRHADKPAARLADDLRRDVDRNLVTANRWGQTREHSRREPHQAVLSDLFGALYDSSWPASPSALGRTLVAQYRLDLDQEAALTLQYGTGHCGEHSRTVFSILRTMMANGARELASVLLCGNANIDHTFVIINLPVDHVLFTRATSTQNTRVKVGGELMVFDLRAAIAANGDRDAFVVDPYLDPSMMSSRATGLLRALHNRRKRQRNKDTDFLMFQRQAPMPSEFVLEDIRDLTFSERQARVKNV